VQILAVGLLENRAQRPFLEMAETETALQGRDVLTTEKGLSHRLFKAKKMQRRALGKYLRIIHTILKCTNPKGES
jgi:hypothetical protein